MHRARIVDTSKVDRNTNIRKPRLALDYNKHMGGVDCSDQLTNAKITIVVQEISLTSLRSECNERLCIV